MGTLLGLILPALTPRCHRFFEVGAFFIHHDNVRRFIEVSPDGLVNCPEECDNHNNPLEVPCGSIMVEIKCPFTPLTNKKILPVAYTPPNYYACQLLSEMKMIGANLLFFISCSLESTTVNVVDFSKDTWDTIWNVSAEKYAVDNPRRPTHMESRSKHLNQLFQNYIDANAQFVAEVPTFSMCG